MAVVGILTLAAFLWSPRNGRMPDELLGEWRTTDPEYAGRELDIDQGSINFVTGNGQVSVGFIKEIKVDYQGDRKLYTISYATDGTPNQVSFYYETKNGSCIRFKNQEKTAWQKVSGG
jgi:hypothetical protein